MTLDPNSTNAPSRAQSLDPSNTNTRLQVRTAVAAMHGDPRISSAWTSQLLAGHVVEVLETRGDWLRVRSEDSYEGWMHRGYLDVSTGDEEQWRVSLGCRVKEASGIVRDLPLLARVSPSSKVLQGSAIENTDLALQYPADTAAIVKSARALFIGASYVWGGVSPWGCDCSGFTQSVYSLHGMRLPRDASQQATALGELDDAEPLASLAAATLPFFSDREDRRITHVGIMLGEGFMAHCGLSRGGFAIEQLGDTHDAYVARLHRDYVGSAPVITRLLPSPAA